MKRINKRNVIDIILLIILVVYNLYMNKSRNIPYIYNDEFGYWATPAFLNNWSWSSLVSTLPYYSFGYGFILWWLYLITGSMQTAYKVSLFINIIWTMLGYYILANCLRCLFPRMATGKIRLISAVSVLFPGILSQTVFSWPEAFLFFLYVCQIWVLIYSIQKYRYDLFALLGVISGYSYYVHQRTVGIAVAITLTITALSIRRRNIRPILFFLLSILITIVLGEIFKSQIISTMWSSSTTVASNNMAGQIGKIEYILSFHGIISLLFSILGKLFYSFSASLLLFPIALWWLYKQLRVVMKKEITSSYIYLFLVLSGMLMILINSVSMIIPYNITHIYYGRYIDSILPIWIAIGIIVILEEKISIKSVLVILGIYLFLIVVVKYQTVCYGLKYQAAINSAGNAYMAENEYFEAKKGFFVPTIVFLALIALNRAVKQKNFRNWSMISVVSLLAVSFLLISVSTVRKFYLDWGYAPEESNRVFSEIKNLPSSGYASIFAYYDEKGSYPQAYPGNGLQFLLEEQPITVLDGLSQFDRLMHDDSEWYLVISTKKLAQIQDIVEEAYDYRVIYQSDLYSLITSN